MYYMEIIVSRILGLSEGSHEVAQGKILIFIYQIITCTNSFLLSKPFSEIFSDAGREFNS